VPRSVPGRSGQAGTPYSRVGASRDARHEAVFSDVDSDILVYHYYADDGSSKLGINLFGWDSSNWPFVH
jgi:arabinan endo-1,5-alpha-L-arabinosidase